jgi:hypothetical protein
MSSDRYEKPDSTTQQFHSSEIQQQELEQVYQLALQQYSTSVQ